MMRRRWTHGLGVMSILLVLSSGPLAWSHSLTVPGFRDDGDVISNGATGSGNAAFIALKNTTDQALTIYIVYTQPDNQGQMVPQAAIPFTMQAKQQINWRPATDDPIEGAGRAIPNTLSGSEPEGSIEIIWIGGPAMKDAIIGRYVELSPRGDMAHVLR